MKKIAIGALALTLLTIAMPYVAFARHIAIGSNVFDPTVLKGPILVCAGTNDDPQLPPCENLCDLIAQIENIIYFLIAVVIWIVVPILVATGGLMIMLGGPNPGMIEAGKKTITGAVIGAAIVLCAWIIVNTVVTFFGITGIGGFGTSTCTVLPPAANTGSIAPAGPAAPVTAPNSCGGSTPGSCPSGQTCQIISGAIVLGGQSTATYGCK